MENLELDKTNKINNNDFFELDNLNNKNDFLKFRAETDSEALKENFQIGKFILKIYQQNRL